MSGTVTDQESERMVCPYAAHQVAGGLGGPGAGRVGGDPGQMHLPSGDLDDEQNMESAKQRGVDAGEVGRENGFRL